MRYLVGIILIVVLVIFGVIFFSGGKNTPKKHIIAPKVLTDYANTDSQVQLTIDGIINADQLHRTIVVNVSRTTNSLEVIQGYQHNVVQSNTFPSNQAAFTNFLYAIYRAGFAKTRKPSLTDERGVCPLGNRYIYEFKNTPDNKDSRRWSVSCGSQGTFGGQAVLVRQLIELQIPGYSNLTSNVNLAAQQ